MENVTVALPASLKEFVDAETSARGFGTPGEYIQAMLREEQKRKVDAEVQAMIEEGLASEAMEWNAETREKMKQEIMERHERGSCRPDTFRGAVIFKSADLDDDLTNELLEHNPKFREMLEQRLKEGTISAARAKVEALMDEAMASGESTEWTKQDVEDMKREVLARHARRHGTHSTV